MITTITDILRLKLLQSLETDYRTYDWYYGRVDELYWTFIKQLRTKDVKGYKE